MQRPRNQFTPKERHLRSELVKLIHWEKMVRGSLIRMSRSCGQEGCRCQRGDKHVSLYLGASKNGKTEMIFIPKDWEDPMKEWVKTFDKVKRLLEKLSDIYRERLRQRRS